VSVVSAGASGDRFGLLGAEARRSPYAAYARMRDEGAVVEVDAWGGAAVVRYAEVQAAFRDARLSSDRGAAFSRMLSPEVRTLLEPLTRNLRSWALLVDPPDHTRLRALIVKAFTPRVVDGLRPKIVELTRILLDDARAHGDGAHFDVVRDLAAPLPVIVIGDLLGLPRDDRHRLKGWSDALASFLGAARPTPEKAANACKAVVDMDAYFRDVLAEKRRTASDDLLGHLVRAEDAGAFLSDQEILSTCAMVLFGGHETTTNLIGNGLAALLTHDSELAKLRAHPELTPNAVEELLRFDSPVQKLGRVAIGDVEIGDARIAKGGRVFLVMGSAHRDPIQFEDADRLDVARKDVKHLGLGFGAHYCVGAALGRMEAQIALDALLALPRLEPSWGELVWHDNSTIRGLEALPVRVG
jgi:cytochrome P450